MGKGGCKPWFIRPLPSRLEVDWGDVMETTCVLGHDAITNGDLTVEEIDKANSAKIRKNGNILYPVYVPCVLQVINVPFRVSFTRLLSLPQVHLSSQLVSR